jgi:hypothetical protein
MLGSFVLAPLGFAFDRRVALLFRQVNPGEMASLIFARSAEGAPDKLFHERPPTHLIQGEPTHGL